jgi:EpsI family protein
MRLKLDVGPFAVLAAGALMVQGVDRQRPMPLAQPLGLAVPTELVGHTAVDRELSGEETAVIGVSDYLLRDYSSADSSGGFNLYIGYYVQQTQGRTIHSPKNCLPGGGWEAINSQFASVTTVEGEAVEVNRYLLQHEQEQVLVLYWYQGRGRVAANEYSVKWDLLRDAAFRGRTEEALVRIVVPIDRGESAAFELAHRVAAQVIPDLKGALPT